MSRGNAGSPTDARNASELPGRVWAQARTVHLPDAPPGAPRNLLHARFTDAGALAASCDDAGGRGGLLVNASGCTVGDVVELVVALDFGPVRLWCGRGRVTGRRVRKNRSGDDLDVVLLDDERAAWERLESITLGVAPARLERAEQRVTAKLKATVRVAGEPAHKATTIDLSPGGAGFVDAERLDVGAPVEIELRPGLFGRALNLRGVVCWAEPHRGFGVRFLFDVPRQKEEVAALIARYG